MVLMAIWFAIFVDARISFLERGWPVLNWMKSDFMYLIMPVALLCQMIAFIHFFPEKNGYLLFVAAGAFIGSFAWDFAFGIVVYDDAFFPFRKWLFNMGFAGKYYWQRYIADGARLLAGGILLYFALKGM
jgi:hypothetical protein